MFELVIKQKPPNRLGFDMSLPNSRERAGLHRHRKWTEISVSANGVALPLIHDLENLPCTSPDFSTLLSSQNHSPLKQQGEYQT
jgi:hypothetical protein